MESNPFAVLSLIVAPAILTNASSVLILSTSNRLGCAVDRAREISKQLEATTDFSGDEPRRRIRELAASEERTLLLLRALRCFYVGLGGFASAAFLSLLGAVLVPVQIYHPVILLELAGVIAGLTAVGAMVFGTVLILQETRIAVNIVNQRATTIRERVEKGHQIIAASDKNL